MDPETVHDGPDPSDDTTVTLAETHGEGVAGELLLVATGGGREHGAGTGPDDVEDEADNGVSSRKRLNGFLALGAANIADFASMGFGFSGRHPKI